METALRSAFTSVSSGSASPSFTAAARLSSRPTRGPLMLVFTPMSSSRSTQRTRVFIATPLLVPRYINVVRLFGSLRASIEAQSLFDPTKLDRCSPRADDRPVGIGHHARADLCRAVICGRDRAGDLEGLLEDSHLPLAGVGMAEDALVRCHGDGPDRPDPRDRAADDGHAEHLADEIDGLVVVGWMDDRTAVVAEDVVPDRAQPMRERIHGIADRVELLVLDERGCEDAVRVHRDEGAEDRRMGDARDHVGRLEGLVHVSDDGFRHAGGYEEALIVRRAEDPHVGVPCDLHAPEQKGPSVLREGDDGRAVLELDRLHPNPARRDLPAPSPEELIQDVVDEDAVRLQVSLHVLPNRFDRPGGAVRAGRGPGGPQGHDHDPLLFLFRHDLTPSAYSVARSGASGAGRSSASSAA